MTTTSTPFRLVADYRMTGDQPAAAIVRLGRAGVNGGLALFPPPQLV